MRTHWLMPALCAASVLLASGCGGDSSGPSDGGGNNPPPEGDILVQNDVFNPSTFSVAAGTAVTWAWDSDGEEHSVTFNTEPIDSHVKTSGTFSHTFTTAGTFAYHCVVHSNMTGTITVSEASGGSNGGNPPGGGTGGGGGGSGGGGYGFMSAAHH